MGYRLVFIDRKPYILFHRFTYRKQAKLLIVYAVLNLWSPKINMSRLCHGRNMSHIRYTLVAPSINNLACKSVKSICEIIYTVYDL